LIHEYRDEAGRHQRHVCKKKLDVSDGGAAVRIDALDDAALSAAADEIAARLSAA
jgi:hypothetical protein